MPRKYELRKRAERQDDTRRRIARAVYELHATIGPAATTVTAIAAQAGVDRVTVYRHFPDEMALYQACLVHWTTSRPLPDDTVWAKIEDPQQRLRVALGALYRHYEDNQGLWSNGWRDIPRLPVLAQADAPVFAQLERMRAVLLQGWPAPEPHARILGAAIGHALEFPTWQSLVHRQGLTTGEAIDVLAASLACLASPPAAGERRSRKSRPAPDNAQTS
jgi:AcrR family transcriptional regulator